MRPTRQHFAYALWHDATVVGLLVSVSCMITGVRCGVAWLGSIGAVLNFASFDAIVFKYVHRQNEQDMQGRAYYRIVQAVYQYGLLLVLAQSFGWWSLLYLALWWVGVCDYLYYLLLQYPISKISAIDDMYWVDWTPQGIVCKLLFKRNLTGREFHTWMWVLSGFTVLAYGVLIWLTRSV